MATYTQIAQDSFSYIREDGSTKTFRWTFDEKDGSAADLNIPLTGFPVVHMGDAGDAPNKPIKVHAIEFKLEDKDSALIDKIKSAGTRQIRVTVEETVAGKTIFEGYVLKDFASEDLYEDVQGVPVRAIGSLADTRETAPHSTEQSWQEFADRIGTSIDLSRDLDIYTSLDHNNRLKTDSLPEEMYIEERSAASTKGGGEGSLLTAIKSMMLSLGWQIFQRNGRLTMVDQYDRFKNRAAIKKWESDGAGGFTETTEDIRVTLDSSNVIRGGKLEQQPNVVKLFHRFNMNARSIFITPQTSTQTVAEDNEYENEVITQGLVMSGDKITFTHEGQLYSDGEPSSTVEGEVGHTRVVLDNKLDGEDDWHYDFDNDEWVQGTTKYYATQSFRFDPPPFGDEGGETQNWLLLRRELAAVPDGVIADLKIILANDLTITNGSASDVGINEQDYAEVDQVIARDSDAAISRVWEVSASETNGKEITSNSYISDKDKFTDQQSFRYRDATSGSKELTNNWLSSTGNGVLGGVVANRLGTVILGSGIESTVRVRDTEDIDLLTALEIEDNEGVTRVCSAKKIEYDLFRGHYDILLREAFDGYSSQKNYYENGVSSESGTTSGTSGSRGGGGLTEEQADSKYLQQDDAENTYLKITDAASTYIEKNTKDRMKSLGVGRPAPATEGRIEAAEDIIAFAGGGGAPQSSGTYSVTQLNASDNIAIRGEQLFEAGSNVFRSSLMPSGVGDVTSVFGRTGAVSAQAGDYSFSDISGSLALSQIAQGGASDGQVLQWNNTAGEWQPAASSGGGGLSASADETITGEWNFEGDLTFSQTDGSIVFSSNSNGAYFQFKDSSGNTHGTFRGYTHSSGEQVVLEGGLRGGYAIGVDATDKDNIWDSGNTLSEFKENALYGIEPGGKGLAFGVGNTRSTVFVWDGSSNNRMLDFLMDGSKIESRVRLDILESDLRSYGGQYSFLAYDGTDGSNSAYIALRTTGHSHNIIASNANGTASLKPLGIAMDGVNDGDVVAYYDTSGRHFAPDHRESSDRRLKSKFKRIKSAREISRHAKLYSFEKEGLDERQIGLIAQDLEKAGHAEIVGWMNHKDYGDGVRTLSGYTLGSIALAGVGELDSEVERLKSRVKELETEVEKLRAA